MSRATCNSLLYLSAFKVGFLISSPYHSDSAVYGMIGDVIKFAQFITEEVFCKSLKCNKRSFQNKLAIEHSSIALNGFLYFCSHAMTSVDTRTDGFDSCD